MRSTLYLLVFVFVVSIGYCQQDSQFTQYMYNTISINPAYAGSRGELSVFGLYRTQWVGLDGAPVTSNLSVHSPIQDTKLGIGVSLLNDRIGPTNENNLSVDLSYTLDTSSDLKVSFGVKATANLFNLDSNKLEPEHQGDLMFQNLDNVLTPNFGAGIYLHSDQAYFGLSVPNFIASKRYDSNEVAIHSDKLSYYALGGYVFDLTENIKFKPAFLTKLSEGSPLQVDLSGNFMFNERFVAGIAYRWSAAFSALLGFQVSEGLYLGYGYDRETTKLVNYSSGSHEIFLRYEFIKRRGRLTSPRFF